MYMQPPERLAVMVFNAIFPIMTLEVAVLAVFGLLGSLQAGAAAVFTRGFNVQPFTIDLSKNVARMFDLIKDTHLPDHEEYPGVSSDLGIPLSTLKKLRKDWISCFKWKKEQDSMNKYELCLILTLLCLLMNRFKHFTAVIEGLTIHFIHEKSQDPNAIPLILNHGWPGSFLEFAPVIEELTKKAQTLTGKSVSFHVVIPSLPGFAFSSSPPQGWTAEGDTARVFNTLMTEVLGYETYATFGTDWGAVPSYGMYEVFNSTCRAGHFAFLPFLPKDLDGLAALNITLDPLEAFEEQVTLTWGKNGASYLTEQTSKVCIIVSRLLTPELIDASPILLDSPYLTTRWDNWHG